MSQIAINPSTLDYSVSNGVPENDSSGGLMNSIIIRLLIPLGSYWADPTIGSLLYQLRQALDIENLTVLAEDYVQSALQPMILDGRLASVTCQATNTQPGWLALLVTAIAATGQIISFTHQIPVGV